MLPGDKLPKLQMAPRETAEEIARRVERERRALDTQREGELEQSLDPFRVGSVPYLNSVPLTRGLEDQIRFAPPAELARLLRGGELDAALVSVTEVLLSDAYDLLDGVAVASLGEVKSVFLAHRKPLEEAREIYCDPASLTSVHLLKVLLAERGLKPAFLTLESYEQARHSDFALLIGNPAIDFLRSGPEHQIWDLGEAWMELTQLPFVFAGWALRRGVANDRLKRLLREAKDFGMDTLDQIIRQRTDYDLDFRKDYLGWHIHFHLGADEKRGIERFVALLEKHGLGPARVPNFV